MPRARAVDRVQEVYATSYCRLVGQLTGVTGDRVEAEDAVMEAFTRALNSSRSFLGADNPEAWLRTVAVNVTRTHWRRGRFFRDVSHRLVAERSYDDLPEDHCPPRSTDSSSAVIPATSPPFPAGGSWRRRPVRW